MYAYQAHAGRTRRTAFLVPPVRRSERPRMGPRTGSRSEVAIRADGSAQGACTDRRTVVRSSHEPNNEDQDPQAGSIRLERAPAVQGGEALPRRLPAGHADVLLAARR